MSPYSRNTMVGVVVLGAVSVMVWMAMEFGGRAATLFAPPRFPVQFVSERADGLAEGSTVNFHGVEVGQVSAIHLKPDMSGVTIDALIDRDRHVPKDVQAKIELTSLLSSGSSIQLFPKEPPSTQPLAVGTIVPRPQLLAAGDTIPAVYKGLDLAALQEKVGGMSDEVENTVRIFRESKGIDKFNDTVQQINWQAQKLGKVLDSVQDIVGDKNVSQNIKETIANIRDTSVTTKELAKKLSALSEGLTKNSADVSLAIKTTQGHIDEIAKQLDARFEQVAKILDTMQSISAKVDNGKGTAGELLNDPKLYQSLVESSNQLNATLATLHRLVDQWEQDGVSLKLNK